jgi:signal transduction histidine kinase
MATDDREQQYIVVFAPLGRDGAVIAEMASRSGFTAQVCANIPQLVECLTMGALAVVIAEEGLFSGDCEQLFDWAQHQPTWSDLPFIVLSSRHEEASIARWRAQVIKRLGNVSLLERPVQTITLMSAIQAASRARQRQYEVRQFLLTKVLAAAELESLVASRTKALEQANRELTIQMQERSRAEAALQQARKIEAIGQLTGGVAHDFNNLLMVITGGLEMLERVQDPQRKQLLVNGMKQAALRGARLTRQLLMFSRRQALHAETIDVARYLEATRELLQRSLGGDTEVRLTVASDVWPIEVDVGELDLAILNLALNARDAMNSGGLVALHARNVLLNNEMELSGDFVMISVIDQGSGMSPDTRERAFEPFFTTKDVGKGSGLGLPQVYGFAKQSGGIATITSELGQGTTVSLYFPRSHNTPAAELMPSDLRSNVHQAESAGRALIVEDSDEVAALVLEMFRELSFKVTRVSNARAALGALSDGREIDIVFSDIMMPGGMNGVELAREIRRRHPGLPIVLTSGYTTTAATELTQEGLVVLHKPYDLKALGEIIDAALETSI